MIKIDFDKLMSYEGWDENEPMLNGCSPDMNKQELEQHFLNASSFITYKRGMCIIYTDITEIENLKELDFDIFFKRRTQGFKFTVSKEEIPSVDVKLRGQIIEVSKKEVRSFIESSEALLDNIEGDSVYAITLLKTFKRLFPIESSFWTPSRVEKLNKLNL